MSEVRGSTLSPEYIKKFAPSVKFHGNEQNFPCDIEYLLQGSKLNYSNWCKSREVKEQATTIPALAGFKDYIYMAYIGTTNSQIYITRSKNGVEWTDTRQIGRKGSALSIAVFKEKLWMMCSSENPAKEVYVTCSSDGLLWEAPRQIPGLQTKTPALVAYEGYLFMCYTSETNQLFHSQSDDGWSWSNTQAISTQSRSAPALTVVTAATGSHVLMVYPSFPLGDGGQLIQQQYHPSSGWTQPSKINQQFSAGQVSLSNSDSTVCMAYVGHNSTQLWSSTSTDNGKNWQFAQVPNQTAKFSPGLCRVKNRTYMLYSGTNSNKPKQIYVTSVWKTLLLHRNPKENPTQQDLADCGDDPDCWISISDRQWRDDNQPRATTIYYALMEDQSSWYIHYIFLYVGQRGQTVRAERIGSKFNAQLFSVGEHAGDLERFMVKISKGTDGRTAEGSVQGCEYEAHGDKEFYTPDRINWEGDHHALVSVPLNSHGCWNEKVKGDHPYDKHVSGLVSIGNFMGGSFGDGEIWWKPWETSTNAKFVQVGLDKDGKPVNDQVWATFQGHMGDSYKTTLKGAKYFNGSNLSGGDWAFVKLVWGGAKAFNLLPVKLLSASGSRGPGGREWVKPVG